MKHWIMLFSMLILMPFQADAGIIVEDAWVRLPPPVADTAAAYMTIKNSGKHDVEIVSIKTPAAKSPEFHSMQMHGNMMHMMKMEKVVVPAGSGISFTPNGNHLMLVDLTGKLETGEHIMMTLQTSEGESIMVHAEVRDMRSHGGSGSNMNHEHGGHDMHDGMQH